MSASGLWAFTTSSEPTAELELALAEEDAVEDEHVVAGKKRKRKLRKRKLQRKSWKGKKKKATKKATRSLIGSESTKGDNAKIFDGDMVASEWVETKDGDGEGSKAPFETPRTRRRRSSIRPPRTRRRRSSIRPEPEYRGSQLLIDGKVVATDSGALLGGGKGKVKLEVTCTLRQCVFALC